MTMANDNLLAKSTMTLPQSSKRHTLASISCVIACCCWLFSSSHGFVVAMVKRAPTSRRPPPPALCGKGCERHPQENIGCLPEPTRYLLNLRHSEEEASNHASSWNTRSPSSAAEIITPEPYKTVTTCPGMSRRSAAVKLTTIAGATAVVAAASMGHVGGICDNSVTIANAATITNKIPTCTLQNGVKMPVLALNTVGLSKDDTERAVGYAVDQGMTHIDFHPGPKERDGVAAYLQKNPKLRSTLFLNTKIRKAPPGTSPLEAADRTRQQIDEDLEALFANCSKMKKQVDMLMLRDSPDCAVIQAQWKVLEEALQKGQTRSIGVINFCQSALECVLQTAKVAPAVNYYMLHVGMGRDAHGLRTFGESKGIKTFAYGTVGEPGPNAELLNSPILKRIGQAHGNKSPEQVALRWVLQTGAAASVRPTVAFGLGTSVCDANTHACLDELTARASSFNWSLTDAEMAELDAITSPDDNPTLFSSAGCPGAFVMPK